MGQNKRKSSHKIALDSNTEYARLATFQAAFTKQKTINETAQPLSSLKEKHVVMTNVVVSWKHSN
jgi:hypothetical protein